VERVSEPDAGRSASAISMASRTTARVTIPATKAQGSRPRPVAQVFSAGGPLRVFSSSRQPGYASRERALHHPSQSARVARRACAVPRSGSSRPYENCPFVAAIARPGRSFPFLDSFFPTGLIHVCITTRHSPFFFSSVHAVTQKSVPWRTGRKKQTTILRRGLRFRLWLVRHPLAAQFCEAGSTA